SLLARTQSGPAGSKKGVLGDYPRTLQLRRHCRVCLSELVEIHAKLRKLPLQPVEHGLTSGNSLCRCCLLTGFRTPAVEGLRDMPKASQGLCAGLRGPMPCARRQRRDASRARSRRSSGVNRIASYSCLNGCRACHCFGADGGERSRVALSFALSVSVNWRAP